MKKSIYYFFVCLFVFIQDVYSSDKQDVCIKPEEKNAIHFRSVYINMSVAESVCGESELFKNAAEHLSKLLNKNSLLLKIFFMRLKGAKNGQKALDSFITSIANDSSLKSMYNKDAYCEKQKKIMTEVINTSYENISGFIKKYSYLNIESPKLCKNTNSEK